MVKAGLLVACLLVFGCGKGDPPAGAADGDGTTLDPTDSGAIDTDEVNHLRSLGYLGVAEPLQEGAAVGVIRYDRKRCAPGLNLFTNAASCSAQLVDMEGHLFHEWTFPDCFRWGNSTLLPNGDLLVVGRLPHDQQNTEAAREARYIMRLNWDGEVVWRKALPVHHDVELTPFGSIATLGFRHVMVPEFSETIPVRDHQLLLLDQAGEVQQEISLLELLRSAPELHQLRTVEPRDFEGSPELDLIHSNAVEFIRLPHLSERDPLYGPSNVLLCLRHQDAVVIFNAETRKLLWSWGQGEISGPHDATMLDNGNILLFDNGLGRRWSRVVEVDPLSREIVWEYRARPKRSFYTYTRGSNQRLSNGNTLVVESDAGRAFEVTSDGRVVWEFVNPNLTEKREPVIIVRMRRYEGLTPEQMVQQVAEGRLGMQD